MSSSLSPVLAALLLSGCLVPVCEVTDDACVAAEAASSVATGSGSRGRALAFETPGAFVSTARPDSSSSVEQTRLTIELWFKTTRGGPLMVERSGLNERIARKRLRVVGGRVCAEQRGLGGAEVCTASAGFADGAWHHAAMVTDGDTRVLLLEVDGAEAGTAAIVGTGGFVFQTWFELGSTGEEAFLGELDDVRVWTVARTVRELAANRARSVAKNSPGLRLALPLDGEGSTEVAADVVGANAGTLTNFSFRPSPWRVEGAW